MTYYVVGRREKRRLRWYFKRTYCINRDDRLQFEDLREQCLGSKVNTLAVVTILSFYPMVFRAQQNIEELSLS